MLFDIVFVYVLAEILQVLLVFVLSFLDETIQESHVLHHLLDLPNHEH